VLPRALARRFLRLQKRDRPAAPHRILVAHHLLAGDVFMLAPLLAKLRARHADAEIVMTVRPALAPLFSTRPYGVRAVSYDPRDAGTLVALFQEPGFDLALVPGDNRYSWLAAAAGARWIAAFAGDRPGYKSWPVDELRRYRAQPTAWSDMVADLADGPPPAPYQPGDWPAPACAAFDAPKSPYAVLHVEASTPVKHWEDARWLALAEKIAARKIQPIWSAGPGGETLLKRIDPAARFPALGHRLDLAQLWHLVAHAALLVCPDTSVMHLGRLTGAPTVALFGPSSAQLFGAGQFWRYARYRAVTVADFPSRDQSRLFKREIAWIRRCQRTAPECVARTGIDWAEAPPCMRAIEVDAVERAAAELL